MKNERKIKLSAAKEASELVKMAGKCDFDVDVFYNRVTIDAKSLLGVLSLDLSKTLTVKYNGDNMNFENFLEQYTIS